MFWNKPKKQGPQQEEKVRLMPVVKAPSPNRNDPCSCGSGKKYKKCCMGRDEAKEHDVSEKQWQQNAALAKEKAEKKAKEAPASGAKPASAPSVMGRHRPTFVPHQVNMPRRSGTN